MIIIAMAANEERIKEFRKDLEKIREDILREFPQPPRAGTVFQIHYELFIFILEFQ